jgi:HD domain
VTNPLSRALYDTTDPPLRLLPAAATSLLLQLDCPPRLAVHLRIVHDVATQVADWVRRHYPALAFDRDAVLFGAATHDIGKTVHVIELTKSGSEHEEAGRALLLDLGVSPDLARFAGTHTSWSAPGITVEDLLVSTADKSWKNKRVPELEDLVVEQLSRADSRAKFAHFLAFDELFTRIGRDSDRRMALQSSFPVELSPAVR